MADRQSFADLMMRFAAAFRQAASIGPLRSRRWRAASSAGPSYGLPGQPEIIGNAGGQYPAPVDTPG